ncbi:MAG: energy coupling factor transporter S component ThiW [Clostridia bacterium]
MSNTKKIVLSGILVAIAVVMSSFYIPIGVAKCFPIQHLINVLAGVLLGPIYAVSVAFVTSLIRVLSGTGSLLAFPGSMCGALLCGLLYKYTKNTSMAFLGEVFGTGVIGALLAFPIATLFLSKTAALFAFVIPFGLSSLVGAAISVVFITALKKAGIFNKLILEGK